MSTLHSRPIGPRVARGLVQALLCLMIGLVAGRANLPAPASKPESPSRRDVDDTALAAVAARSLPADAGARSGFRLLPDGDHALATRLALIERAQRSIDAQYYSIADDASGRAFLRALRDAAARGVRVRLLVDDLHVAAVEPWLAALDTQPHAEVRLFNPLPARVGGAATRLAPSLHEFTRVNRRMHNKLFVADGRIAVSGGRNIGDEYFLNH